MSQFIIEYELEKVKSKKTKKYLLEVLKNYNSGCYRSALVVLYSIVIYDLVEKLKTLSYMYKDKIANDILEKIKSEQKNNQKSPKWEKNLLISIKDRTQLINDVEYKKIEHLIDDRNYCAHPLYDNNYELISPHKEETRAHIRNMFEIIFKKDALLSKKISSNLLDDIAKYNECIGIKDIEIYFKEKYLNHFNESTKIEIFKLLWKMVFVLENDHDASKNRKINFKILKYLIIENKELILKEIQLNSSLYKEIPIENIEYDDKENWYKYRFVSLIYLIFYVPELKNYLGEHIINTINKIISKNISLYLLIKYPNQDEDSFLQEILKRVEDNCFNQDHSWHFAEKYHSLSPKIIKKLNKKIVENGDNKPLVHFCSDYFINSQTFSFSKNIFFDIIVDMLDYFSLNDFNYLLEGMNKNSQIYNLFECKEIGDVLKMYINKKKYQIDFSIYDKLFS